MSEKNSTPFTTEQVKAVAARIYDLIKNLQPGESVTIFTDYLVTCLTPKPGEKMRVRLGNPAGSGQVWILPE